MRNTDLQGSFEVNHEMKVLTSNFSQASSWGQASLTLVQPWPERVHQSSKGNHARRSLPHRVPCVDAATAGKSFGNCKALHQSQRRFLFSVARNNLEWGPLACCFPALLPQTFSPTPSWFHTRTRSPHTGHVPATPSPTPRNLRAPLGPGRAPRLAPAPARFPAAPPARPAGGRFPRQPRGRSAAAWARAPKKARGAGARARSCRRRRAARAPSVVGGGAERARSRGARGRGGWGGSASRGRRRCRAERIPSPGSRYVSPQPAGRGTPATLPGSCGRGGGEASQGLQGTCPAGPGILPLTFIPLSRG